MQDALKVSQQSPGTFEIPNWDEASLNKVRAALLQLGETISDTRRMFGAKYQVDPVRRMFGATDQVDPVRHLVGTALLWGGNPEKDALYLPVTPARNDGTTIHKLTVKDVPVDGFWSITVYNAEGYLEPNRYNAYAVNKFTAKKDADGSVAIQFGGCDGKIPNCLPIMTGWNYTVRPFRLAPEILDGTWRFPEAQPVSYIKPALAAVAPLIGSGGTIGAQAQAQSSTTTADEAAIRETLTSYEAALNTSDTTAVVPLYTDDGVFMAPYGPSAVGKAAVQRAYDVGFEAVTLHLKFNVAEIAEMSPEWAFARTNSGGTITVNATGAKKAEAGQELFIFRKGSDGAWKIARYSFSATNPPPK